MHKSKIKNWMKKQLQKDPEPYLDCNEVIATKLAEDAADTLSLYEENDMFAYIPDVVFDAAVEVGEWYEKLK